MISLLEYFRLILVNEFDSWVMGIKELLLVKFRLMRWVQKLDSTWLMWHTNQTYPNKHFSKWFLVTGVDNHIFSSEFMDPIDQNTPWTSWSSYDVHLQMLLVRLTSSKAHETASMTFHNSLVEALQHTDLHCHVKEFGSATRYVCVGAKEPDQAWRRSRRTLAFRVEHPETGRVPCSRSPIPN